jgi:PAS domain S-box-containing protein
MRKLLPLHSEDSAWQIIAIRLADSHSQPAVVLDDRAHIHLVSTAFERVGGYRREEVVGRSWVDLFTPSDRIDSTLQDFERAARGSPTASPLEIDTDIVTKDKRRLELRLKTFGISVLDDNTGTVKKRPSQHRATLLTVSNVRHVERGPFRARDVEYEIAPSHVDFGKLVNAAATSAAGSPLSSHCYSAFEGRTSPCPDCPILVRNGEWPRSTVRRDADGYELITAELVGVSFYVRRQRLADNAIAAVREAKIDALAADAKLSERESAVLRYLILGRSLDDIASILGITTRTVKFHQTNILEKVGADSRADLSRFIL